MQNDHEHVWRYEHTIWEGRRRNPDECSVVRYCACGVKQMAYTGEWKKLPRNHDANKVVGNG